jgi:predicted transcriptional regulator
VRIPENNRRVHRQDETMMDIEKIVQGKELKRIEWGIIVRLVKLLYFNRKIKRTKIAMQCNMSYDKCVLYLDWLEMMDVIEKEIDKEGYTLIQLSERGSDLYQKKFRSLENYI